VYLDESSAAIVPSHLPDYSDVGPDFWIPARTRQLIQGEFCILNESATPLDLDGVVLVAMAAGGPQNRSIRASRRDFLGRFKGQRKSQGLFRNTPPHSIDYFIRGAERAKYGDAATCAIGFDIDVPQGNARAVALVTRRRAKQLYGKLDCRQPRSGRVD
jgi:hypothetical protein